MVTRYQQNGKYYKNVPSTNISTDQALGSHDRKKKHLRTDQTYFNSITGVYYNQHGHDVKVQTDYGVHTDSAKDSGKYVT